MLEVYQINDDYPFELLLLADETMEAIHTYLYASGVYIAKRKNSKETIGVFCLYPINADTVEVKNIAVSPEYQNQGIGSFLLGEAERIAHERQYKEIIVGTGDCGFRQIHFYEKNGYVRYDIRKNFFTENYDWPIFENGIMLKDMVLLKKAVQVNSYESNSELSNSKPSFTIRAATTADITELSKLFQETVLAINKENYSAEEVEDWASCGNDPERWEKLFSTQHIMVTEDTERTITGFTSIRGDGYLDLLFVHKDFQRKGIATLLYNTVEIYARSKGLQKITVEVSITAKPFFEKQGFETDEEQKKKANKLYLTNYKMSKSLT